MTRVWHLDMETVTISIGEELGALAQAKKIIKEAVALDQQQESPYFLQVSQSVETQAVRLVKKLAEKQRIAQEKRRIEEDEKVIHTHSSGLNTITIIIFIIEYMYI